MHSPGGSGCPPSESLHLLLDPGSLPARSRLPGISSGKLCAAAPRGLWPREGGGAAPFGICGCPAASAPAWEPEAGARACGPQAGWPARPRPGLRPFEGGGAAGPGALSWPQSRASRRHQNNSAAGGGGRGSRTSGRTGAASLATPGRVTPHPTPQRGADQTAALGPGCVEEAASRPGRRQGRPRDHMGGGRSRSPGLLCPEPGRRRRQREPRCLLALPPSPPGLGRPARQVSGARGARPPAPGPRGPRPPASGLSGLSAPTPWRPSAPGPFLRPQPLSGASPRGGPPTPAPLAGPPCPGRWSSSPRPAGTWVAECRGRRNWASRANRLGTSRLRLARSPLAGSKVREPGRASGLRRPGSWGGTEAQPGQRGSHRARKRAGCPMARARAPRAP